MKLLTGLAALAITQPAFALYPADPPPPSGGGTTVVPQQQQQAQGQDQQQGQQQSLAATTESQAAATAVSVGTGVGVGIGNGGEVGDISNTQQLNLSYRDRLQAPALMAPAVYASGPCAYGWSVGVSVPGAGVTGGKSRTDPGCDRRELARVLTPLQPALALKLLCADPMLAEVALPEDCVYFTPPVVIATPAPAPLDPRYATPGDVSEKVNRAFEASQAKGAQ